MSHGCKACSKFVNECWLTCTATLIIILHILCTLSIFNANIPELVTEPNVMTFLYKIKWFLIHNSY